MPGLPPNPSSVPTDDDVRSSAATRTAGAGRVLAEVDQATLAGGPVPVRPSAAARADSWARVRRHGVDPDRGTDARPISTEQLEQRRWESGLADVLPAAGRAGHGGRRGPHHSRGRRGRPGLWRDGCSSVRRRADGLGFVEGAAWDENTVGTNAIGTALVVRAAPGGRRRLSPWRGDGRAVTLTCGAVVVELRGFEPLTPCMPSRGPHRNAHHVTARSRPLHHPSKAGK